MKSNLKYYLTIFAFFVAFNSKGQTAVRSHHSRSHAKQFATIPNFRIGDQLPDVTLKLLTGPVSTINTAEYKDKLLILDFWETSCGTCIEALPHMDALQKAYGDRIKILPVNCEGKAEELVKWWKTNWHTKDLSIASTVGDTILSSYFNRSFIPHEVWVYKGKVIGITYAEYVDAYNVDRVLKGEIPNWTIKNDFISYDIQNKPLNGAKEKSYAKLFGCMEIGGVIASPGGKAVFGLVKDSVNKTIRCYILNESILDCYLILKYTQTRKVIPENSYLSFVLWDVADQFKYQFNADKREGFYYQDWLRKKAISFESLYPDTGQTKEQITRAEIKDLDSLLGVQTGWIKRKEKVLLIYRIHKNGKFLERDKVPNGAGISPYGISALMNTNLKTTYVFDETNLNYQYIMPIKINNWADVSAIRKAMAPYGIGIKEEVRLVDRFLFREVNRPKPAAHKI